MGASGGAAARAVCHPRCAFSRRSRAGSPASRATVLFCAGGFERNYLWRRPTPFLNKGTVGNFCVFLFSGCSTVGRHVHFFATPFPARLPKATPPTKKLSWRFFWKIFLEAGKNTIFTVFLVR